MPRPFWLSSSPAKPIGMSSTPGKVIETTVEVPIYVPVPEPDPVPGETFLVPLDTSAVAIEQSGSYEELSPGDTLVLEAGTRGALVVTGVHGTIEQPITIRNIAGGTVRFTAGTVEPAISLVNCSHVVLDGRGGTTSTAVRGIVIDSATFTGGVRASGDESHDITVRNISVANVAGIGIELCTAGPTAMYHRVIAALGALRVIDCTITAPTGDGVKIGHGSYFTETGGLLAPVVTGLRITGCSIIDAGGAGVLVGAVSIGQVVGNRILDATNAGVSVLAGLACDVRENEIDTPGGAGIVTGAVNGNIAFNTITTPGAEKLVRVEQEANTPGGTIGSVAVVHNTGFVPVDDATVEIVRTIEAVLLKNNLWYVVGATLPFITYGAGSEAITTLDGEYTSRVAADVDFVDAASDPPDLRIYDTSLAIGTGRYPTPETSPVPVRYALTVTTVGSGTVTKVPDQADYAPNADVQLTAAPVGEGWSFAGWSGGASGAANPLTVTMTSDIAITATFAYTPPTRYTLTTTPTGNGVISRNPDQADYAPDAVVQLQAVPAGGWNFVEWTGDLSGSANPTTITMTGNRSVGATFAMTPMNYQVTLTTIGSGSVTPSPAGWDYPADTVVTLTANPASGWRFVGWSGSVTGTNPTVQFTMPASTVSITATFEPIPAPTYTLTVSITGSGTVAKNPDKAAYTAGEVVTLTATAAVDWDFDHWTGAASGGAPSVQVTMDADTSIGAVFVPEEPAVPVKPTIEEFSIPSGSRLLFIALNASGTYIQASTTFPAINGSGTVETSNQTIQPGDFLIVAAGARGGFQIMSVAGTEADPITFANDGAAVRSCATWLAAKSTYASTSPPSGWTKLGDGSVVPTGWPASGGIATTTTASPKSDKAFYLVGCRHIHFDGRGNGAESGGVRKYGFTIALGGVTALCISGEGRTEGLWFTHVAMQNAKCGIQIQAQPSSTLNRYTADPELGVPWKVRGCRVRCCLIDDMGPGIPSEGMYLGFTSYWREYNGYLPCEHTELDVFDNDVSNCDYDGIQASFSFAHVHWNRIYNTGRTDTAGQKAGIIMNPALGPFEVDHNLIDTGRIGLEVQQSGAGHIHHNQITRQSSESFVFVKLPTTGDVNLSGDDDPAATPPGAECLVEYNTLWATGNGYIWFMRDCAGTRMKRNLVVSPLAGATSTLYVLAAQAVGHTFFGSTDPLDGDADEDYRNTAVAGVGFVAYPSGTDKAAREALMILATGSLAEGKGCHPVIGAVWEGGNPEPPPSSYTLTVAASPPEGGTVTKDPDLSAYEPDAVVAVEAHPGGGYGFDHWEGALTGSMNPANVTMNANKSVTAVFTATGGGEEGEFYPMTFDGAADFGRTPTGDGNPFFGLSAFSIEALFYCSGLATGDYGIYWWHNASGTGGLWIDSGRVRFDFYLSGAQMVSAYFGTLNGVDYIGRWVAVGFSWTSGSAPIGRIWTQAAGEDSTLDSATGPMTGTGTANLDHTEVGRHPYGKWYFPGTIVYVRAYQDGRTVQEMADAAFDQDIVDANLITNYVSRVNTGQTVANEANSGTYDLQRGATASEEADDFNFADVADNVDETTGEPEYLGAPPPPPSDTLYPLLFNGSNQYAQIAGSPLNGLSAFTLEVYFSHWTGDYASSVPDVLLWWKSSTVGGLDIRNGQIRLRLDCTGADVPDFNSGPYQQPTYQNTYVHYAVRWASGEAPQSRVWTPAGIQTYTAGTTADGTVEGALSPTLIGRHPHDPVSYPYHFPGRIYYARLWSDKRTDAEIDDNRSDPKLAAGDNLVWQLAAEDDTLQVIPNPANPGTHDITRGNSVNADGDDPAFGIAFTTFNATTGEPE
jgi:uncharacterized repeat protein (TIGR02543 family)